MLPPTLSCEVRSSLTPRSWNRRARALEAVVPVVLTGDEHRDAVHEAAAGLEDLLDVPLGGLLGSDWEVGDNHVGAGLLEHLDDVHRRARGLGDLLAQILAESVVGHTAHDLDPELGNVGVELQGVVLAGEDRLGQVFADLVGVDVEGGAELDVAHVVAAEIDVHQPRDGRPGISVTVVMNALDERARAVAHADDGDADGVVLMASGAVRGTVFAHL